MDSSMNSFVFAILQLPTLLTVNRNNSELFLF
jgi:hypothetical protein